MADRELLNLNEKRGNHKKQKSKPGSHNRSCSASVALLLEISRRLSRGREWLRTAVSRRKEGGGRERNIVLI